MSFAIPSLEAIGPFNGPRVFLTAFALALALQVSRCFAEQRTFFRHRAAHAPTGRLLGLVPIPRLRESHFLLAGNVLRISLLAAAAGVLPRLTLAIALVSYFLYFSQILPLAYVVRTTHIVPLILVILLAAPDLGASYAAPAPWWPLLLIKLCIAAVYFSSACTKLRHSGLRWISGENLQANLLDHYLWGGRRAALWLAQKPALCTALGAATLLLEVTFPIILFLPALSLPYALAGLALHAGTRATMLIEYTRYFCLSYLVFVVDLMARPELSRLTL